MSCAGAAAELVGKQLISCLCRQRGRARGELLSRWQTERHIADSLRGGGGGRSPLAPHPMPGPAFSRPAPGRRPAPRARTPGSVPLQQNIFVHSQLCVFTSGRPGLQTILRARVLFSRKIRCASSDVSDSRVPRRCPAVTFPLDGTAGCGQLLRRTHISQIVKNNGQRRRP